MKKRGFWNKENMARFKDALDFKPELQQENMCMAQMEDNTSNQEKLVLLIEQQQHLTWEQQ